MIQEIVADLHNHTTASDGDYTPAELVQQAKELGLNAVAVSDHDTLSGLKEAVNEGVRADIDVISAVEVTIRFKREYFVGSLHLLVYFPNSMLGDDEFIADINDVLSKGRGDELVKERVRVINEIFGPESPTPRLERELTFDEVASYSDSVTRRHFALALSEKHGLTSREAVNELIANDSKAYVPAGLDLNQLRPFLDKYDLLVVLAHPAAGSFPGDSHYKEVLPDVSIVEKILPEFIECGIGGLEVYYPGHTQEHTDLLLKWCSKYNLIPTGGSDCHDESSRALGVAGLDQTAYNVFKERLTGE